MSVLDYIYAALVTVWSKHDNMITGGFIYAFIVSSLKTWNDGDWRFKEAMLCGFICMSVFGAVEALGFNAALSAPFVGVLSYYGSHNTMQWLAGIFHIKDKGDNHGE